MTGKILAVEDCKNISEILALFLESEFEEEVILAKSGKEGINHLKKWGNDIKLIYSDYTMPYGDGHEIYTYNVENNLNIPFILTPAKYPQKFERVFTHGKGDFPVSVIPKPYLQEEIIGVGRRYLTDVENSTQYRKIHYNHIKYLKANSYTLYIRISEIKFVPIFAEGNGELEDFLQKYRDRGVEYFYIERENFKSSIKESLGNLKERLVQDDIEFKDRLILQMDSVEGIHRSLKEIGMTPQTIEITEEIIQTTLKEVRKSPGLISIINELFSEKGFIYELGILTAYISTALASELKWGNKENYKSLVMASIFQDVSLRRPYMAKILFLHDPLVHSLSEHEKNLVITHPIDSITILEEGMDIDKMVQKLILHHHELPEGNGFPKRLDASTLSEMECTYIMSHYFAQNLVKYPPSKEHLVQLYLTTQETFYQKGFEKPLEAFKKVFGQELLGK